MMFGPSDGNPPTRPKHAVEHQTVFQRRIGSAVDMTVPQAELPARPFPTIWCGMNQEGITTWAIDWDEFFTCHPRQWACKERLGARVATATAPGFVMRPMPTLKKWKDVTRNTSTHAGTRFLPTRLASVGSVHPRRQGLDTNTWAHSTLPTPRWPSKMHVTCTRADKRA